MRRESRAHWLLAFVVALALPAQAQVQRPGQEPLPVPEFAPEDEGSPPLRLPPIAIPGREPPGEAGSGRLFVAEFRFKGNTVFPDAELEAVTAQYTGVGGRWLSAEDLAAVRDAVTRHYIEHGYVTSGAVIPEQRPSEDVFEIRIVEGRLAGIRVEGTERFRRRYIEDRLALAARGPVNVHQVQQRLQILQQDARIRRIQARLLPGELRGESVLDARVEEESPYLLELFAANDESPSIGSAHSQLHFEHANLTGNGDVFQATAGLTEGLSEWDVRYTIPVNAHDTLLEFRAERSDADVVESPFDELDIESKSITYGVGARHPLYRSAAAELWLGVRGELRRSSTYLLGRSFSFTRGPDDGRTKLSILRLTQDWSWKTRDQVIVARSMFSFGLDMFDATDTAGSSDVPNGTFFAWLGQFQWVRRLPERYRGTQLLVRADVQLTPDPLFSMEQFAVGGSNTVRGYRENTLVRDNAAVTSLEVRIPLLRSALGREVLQLAPFADFGHAWNHDDASRIKTLSSLGVGLRYQVSERLFVSAYWGGRLRSVPRPDDENLQDKGWSLQATWRAF